MKFYTVLASRPDYFDRMPTAGNQQYNAQTVAPAANVTRWTYTVPSNRKAFIEAGATAAIRDGVATGGASAVATIQYTPNGGSVSNMVYSIFIGNTLGLSAIANVGSIGMANAGDAVKGLTNDSSSDGTCTFQLSVKYTEFSA